jgi:DNA polymerase III subunit alpha
VGVARRIPRAPGHTHPPTNRHMKGHGVRIVPTSRWRIEPTQNRASGWWSLHTHSRYSVNDAMAEVDAIVAKVAKLGQPALAITDHGNMAASVELYQACRKVGIAPFPGSELYFVPDTAQYRSDRANKKVKAVMYHLGVVAYTTEGYEHLVRLSTASHRNHHYKPLVDYRMLAQLADDDHLQGLAVTTGCFFGYLTQVLLTQGEPQALQFLRTLASWFPESVYVEVQNHHITHDEGVDDEQIADSLVALADQLGLPVVLTQDSHYLDAEDHADHDGLKRLVAFGPDPDDAVFPGDSFHVCDARWVAAHHGERRLARGMEGLGDLLGRHTLTIPVLDTYSYAVPEVVATPQTAMAGRCQAAMEGMFAPMPVPKRYQIRLHDELEVIEASGMAGYLMLVAQVTDWLRGKDIMFQTRGSAAGSVVCWLLGISGVDPIKWNLRFERFLSKDRTKPPDVDLDVAHDRRDELLEMLNIRFTAHQIGSWATYSLNDTVDLEGDTQRGSLRVRYFTAAGKKDEGARSWAEVPPEDKVMLASLSDRHLYKGMGTNAAGIVLTSTKDDFERLVPMAWMARGNNAGGFVTQYAKDEIEALGLVKLDALGLKTMTVLDRTMRLLGLPISRIADIEHKDQPTYQLIRSGNTEGVFQLEGRTTQWGLRDLKPTTIKDVIAAMALFRPATMNTGATRAYIARKHGQAAMPLRHELIARVVKETYGIMLYQEQVIDLLRGLGMDADNLTTFLKAVKASNKDIGDAGKVILGYQHWISMRCQAEGMSQDDQDYLAAAIAGFAEYGFNRAHATVYGITAYRCAYLAARHPLEYHTALLGVASGGESKKEDRYVRATRRRGIRVLAPDINISGATYTVDEARAAIRRGLQSIDGVGQISAARLEALQPFRDLDDLVLRAAAQTVSGHKEYDGTPESLTGVLGKLRDSGCLERLSNVRSIHAQM